MNNNQVNVGDIITARYLDFAGNMQTGLFLVYSTDKETLGNKGSSAFNTLKISSEPDSFQVLLEMKYYQFLNHDSWVNCNTNQRLHQGQVKQVLGRVSGYTLQLIKNQMKHFNQVVFDDMDKYIASNKYADNYSINPNRGALRLDRHNNLRANGETLTLDSLSDMVVAKLLNKIDKKEDC